VTLKKPASVIAEKPVNVGQNGQKDAPVTLVTLFFIFL
jgi:hypothetical protein